MGEAIFDGHCRIAGVLWAIHGLQEEMLKIELFELILAAHPAEKIPALFPDLSSAE